jgi:hypothetical protein
VAIAAGKRDAENGKVYRIFLKNNNLKIEELSLPEL